MAPRAPTRLPRWASPVRRGARRRRPRPRPRSAPRAPRRRPPPLTRRRSLAAAAAAAAAQATSLRSSATSSSPMVRRRSPAWRRTFFSLAADRPPAETPNARRRLVHRERRRAAAAPGVRFQTGHTHTETTRLNHHPPAHPRSPTRAPGLLPLFRVARRRLLPLLAHGPPRARRARRLPRHRLRAPHLRNQHVVPR